MFVKEQKVKHGKAARYIIVNKFSEKVLNFVESLELDRSKRAVQVPKQLLLDPREG